MENAQTSYPIIRLGTRNSPLAMAQAHEVRARLCTAHDWPEEAVEIVSVTASGDKVQDRPLAEIGGKALWTKELDQWLFEGKIDASVHSAKDVETIRPAELSFAAVLPRADRRDCLIGAGSIAELPKGAIVGTSAPRRAAQLLHMRPDCEVVMFRGNVATRLAKLEAGEADATFLAAAGLERLGQSAVGNPLDPNDWLPAAGQGAIVVEAMADSDAQKQIAALDDAATHAELNAERSLLAALGGTCHSPVATECLFADGILSMRAAIFSEDGTERVDASAEFAAGDLDIVTALAHDLLGRASPAIRQHFTGHE
ncbi:MAG: hydroxymethylbilane synthase [Erythrobacter sp.]